MRFAAREAPAILRTGGPLPYSTLCAWAACSLVSGGAMTMAVAKISAEAASRPAAPSTGHMRSGRDGAISSALASSIAAASKAENGLGIGATINGVAPRANIAALGAGGPTA